MESSITKDVFSNVDYYTSRRGQIVNSLLSGLYSGTALQLCQQFVAIRPEKNARSSSFSNFTLDFCCYTRYFKVWGHGAGASFRSLYLETIYWLWN